MDARIFHELRAIAGERAVMTSPEELHTYECDGLTNFRVMPWAVLLPNSTEQVQAIVQAEHVRAAGAEDAFTGMLPGLVVEPANEQELAEVLRLANDAGLAVFPRGGRTKLEWGNPLKRADVVFSMARLKRIVITTARGHAMAPVAINVR